jgi:inner membrane protein
MTARTHDAFAFASLVLAAAFYQPESINVLTLFTAVIGNNIGALLPDMDSAGNRLWDLLPAGDQVGKIFRRIFYKHRTLSHSFLGLFAIYKILEFGLPKLLNPASIDSTIVLYSIMIGYLSHLIADCLTKEGLPLLFPFRFNFGFPPVKAFRIRTGSWLEMYLIYPGIWLFLIFFIRYNQDKFVDILRNVGS